MPTVILVVMTISGHNEGIQKVRIADLKARLSEYLRAVKGGETIAVLERDRPVAQIVPVHRRPALRVRKPAPGASLHTVPMPKTRKLNVDIVELLLEERKSHR